MAISPFSVVASHVWIGGTFRPARVGVRDGVIDEVVPLASRYLPVGPPGDVGGEVYRLPEDTILLPGLVDPHVRVSEPGHAEGEGFRSATLAAAAGGITTLLDMTPGPVAPATSEEALRITRKAAGRNAFVDVGFWGGAVAGNLGSLAALHRAGVFGFACFFSPSGVDESLDAGQLRRAMEEVAALGSRMAVHAGLSDIETVIEAVRRTGCRTHIAHLGDGAALSAVRAAKREGLPLTVETCPSHLSLAAAELPDGADDRDLLWRGVLDGTVDAIVDDGVPGLEAGLSAVWTEAKRRRIPLSTLLPLFTTGPAAVAGIDGAGEIAVGRPANLTVFGPDRPMPIRAGKPRNRAGVGAYDGRALVGRILHTWLHGVTVFDAQTGGPGHAPSLRRTPKGRLLSAS
jgi:allantoinase